MKNKRILIVEDDEPLLLSLAANLRKSGYEVVAVSAMDDAIRALGSQRFDILLVDLSVEGRSGEELFYFLGVSLFPQPEKIIAITGDPCGLDGIQLGSIVTSILAKPFRFEDLLEELLRPPPSS